MSSPFDDETRRPGEHARTADRTSGNESDASKLPKICPACHSAAAREEPTCLQCGIRPDPGQWCTPDDLDDPWLGAYVGGRWEIRQPLAEGTTGRVYRAVDGRRDAAPSEVALKVVDLDRFALEDDPTALRDRARTEAAAMAGVQSPHIADVHDFLELGDTTFALVMEFVTGPTLTDLVDDHAPLSWDRGLQLGASLAFAVAEIHGARILHCDIKPDNIIVTNSGSGGDLLKLIDFGLAERLHTPHLKGGQQVDAIGTPLFASPEQVRTDPIGPASDVYSIGATIFFALTGRPPILETSLADLHAAHRYRTAPTLENVVQDRQVPTALNNLLADMMARSPDERPTDLYEIGRRLREIADIIDGTAGSETTLADQTSSTLLESPNTDAEIAPSDDSEDDSKQEIGQTGQTGNSSNFAVSTHASRTLTVLTLPDGEAKFTFDDPFGDNWTRLPITGAPCAADACAEAGTVAIGQRDGTVSVFRVIDDGAERIVRLRLDDRPRKLRHAPDGYLIAVETRHICHVYCTASGELVQSMDREAATDLGF